MGIDQGLCGKTEEIIPWGYRKATYTFTIKDSSDKAFIPRIEQAMVELINQKPPHRSDSPFIASNGVNVHISYPDINYDVVPNF